MARVRRWWPWAAVLLWVAAAGVGWDALRTSRDGLHGLLYNADFLAPAALYQDLVHDGYPLAGYQFSAATFAVPDQAVYFAARAACGSHAVAMPVWCGGLFLLLTVAGAWAAAELHPGRRREAVTVWVGLSAAYLAANAARGFAHPLNDLLLPVWHNGAATLALAGLAVSLRLARTGSARWAAGLATVAAAGLFSDRLFGFYLLAPGAVVVAAAWAGGWVRWRRAAAWLAAAVGGGLFGLAALKAFQGEADPIDHYALDLNLEQLAERAGRLAAVVRGELESGNTLVTVAVGWYGWAVVSGLVGPVVGRLTAAGAVVRLGSLGMLAGVSVAFLLSKSADDCLAAGQWGVFSRYFVGPVVAAALGWATLLVNRGWRLPVIGAVAAVGWAVATPVAVDRPAHDWQPTIVRAVDEACRARGLTHGLAGYGDAKPCTLMSRAGVTVRQVRPDSGTPGGLTAFPWLSNAEWYARGPNGRPGRFQFVLAADLAGGADTLAVADVVAGLGEPAERVPLGDRVLLVYDRPTDWRLERFGAQDVRVLGRPFELGRARRIVYPGAGMRRPAEAVTDDTPALTRVAREGRTAEGVIAYGPHLAVRRRGWHRVTYRLSADPGWCGPVGYVDVVWHRPDGKACEVLAVAEVFPDGDQELPFDIRLSSRRLGGQLEFRLYYIGRGTVTLHSVTVERRPNGAVAHQPRVPGPPLNGPTTSDVTQPP